MKRTQTLTFSQCMYFESLSDAPKGRLLTCPAAAMTFVTPITLKAKDLLLIDMQTHKLEKVVRDNITIWRSGWVN